MKTLFLRLFLMLGLLSATIGSVRAEDLAAVKGRMSKRLSTLDSWKNQGLIGENNRGLVELRGANAEAGEVVAAENRDREAVYVALAQQTGSTAETVARARAKQIAAGSATGVWLQRENGDWHKK
ncbi:MAG: DUF1318 domain-containing protein [Opitutaceae bacterium]|jgi:hypothetical protein